MARRDEIYESGSGILGDIKIGIGGRKSHDELLVRTSDGKIVRISRNRKLSGDLREKLGDLIRYHGYAVPGTDIVHRVHRNPGMIDGGIEILHRRN